MNTKKLSLGFGSVLALFAANVLLFATGASAGEFRCEDCWCFGDVCSEEEFGFEQCIPGWSPHPETREMVLDQTIDPISGQKTGESCGNPN